MTQFLPPNLLALFAARDPLPFLPPPCKLSHEKQRSGYTGIGPHVHLFEDPSETPPIKKGENREERRERRRKEKGEQATYKLEQQIAVWTPQESASTGDAYKTLFVGRINFDTSESKLRREFESHGPVKKIVMVYNKKTGKPRGYAFVEYEHERDMHSAYKHADGKKIDGRRVVVDIERGRTVQGWLPRRLGGGLGKTRLGGPEQNVKISGRDVDIDRERLFRDEDRGRDRDRRDRSRDRDSSRPKRDRKEKDKDSRRRSKDRDRDSKRDKDRKRRRSKSPRSRSRDRKDPEEKEKRKRSRSPKEKKKKRSRSRDRDEKKKDKRDREHKRDKRDKDKDKDDYDLNRVKVKNEPMDDEYPDDGYPMEDGYMKVKTERGDNNDDYDNNYGSYDDGYAAY